MYKKPILLQHLSWSRIHVTSVFVCDFLLDIWGMTGCSWSIVPQVIQFFRKLRKEGGNWRGRGCTHPLVKRNTKEILGKGIKSCSVNWSCIIALHIPSLYIFIKSKFKDFSGMTLNFSRTENYWSWLRHIQLNTHLPIIQNTCNSDMLRRNCTRPATPHNLEVWKQGNKKLRGGWH